MKVVVLGGSGLIGRKVVALLRAEGHEAVPASPSSGVDTITGAGLAEALAGADAVVDVINSRSFDGVVEFFETSTVNTTTAAREAGLQHYVLLSIVGTDEVPGAPYLVAKHRQEEIVRASGVPFTIVRATQFFEFLLGLADAGTVDGTVESSAALVQPIAADDVAAELARVVTGHASDATLEVAGPETRPLAEMLDLALRTAGDPRPVVTLDGFSYFGATVERDTLVPGQDARIASTTFAEWSA